MQSVCVLLNTIEKVKSFVGTVSKFDTDVDLISGGYVVNAKSIMGVFSLNILQPIRVNIHGDKMTQNTVLNGIQPYVYQG